MFGGPQLPPPSYTNSVMDRAQHILYRPSTALQLAPQTGGTSSSSHVPSYGSYYQMPTFANYVDGRPAFAMLGMPSSIPMPLFTGSTYVSPVQFCPPLTKNTSFGPKVGSSLDMPNVDGSSSPPQDGQDGDGDDVHKEMNVQALQQKRKKYSVWRCMTQISEA